MRLVLAPATVETDGEGRLLAVTFRGRRRPVERQLEAWDWRGRWWQDPSLQGEERRYLRVLCAGAVFELCRRRRPGQADDWLLSRILD